MQNYCNDYGMEFIYSSNFETQQQRDTDQWQGGINLHAIENAERLAYAYHYWYREKAPSAWTNRTVLIRSPDMTGTCHHLGKLPFIRESRRSIGDDNFLMNITSITGHARDLHGYIFDEKLFVSTVHTQLLSYSSILSSSTSNDQSRY